MNPHHFFSRFKRGWKIVVSSAKKYLVRWIAQSYRKASLRAIFIVPFASLIFATVGLTGWLSLRNGQMAVNDVAMQLRTEITARIQERLQIQLAIPHLVNRLNANAIAIGELNLQDSHKREHHFINQLQAFPEINSNYVGNGAGEFFGAIRLADSALQIMLADRTTHQDLHFYDLNSKGERATLNKKTPNFDPRSRPWYEAAVQQGSPTWSDIYADFVSKELQITAVQPWHDASGQLLGVLGTSLFFTQVNDFLRSLRIGRSGQTFIIERSGLLVTTSTRAPVFTINEQKTERIKVTDSENILMRSTAIHLQKRFGDFANIENAYQLDFEIAGSRQFIQVTPLRDGRGLDWLIVVVVPEADFMERIDVNTLYTILLTLAALLLALLVGILAARQVVRPILRLNIAAKSLAKGEWEQTIEIEREDELGELAKSFNSMAKQLKESFDTLRENESRLTQFLEAMPVGITVREASGRLYYANQKAQQLFGIGRTTSVAERLVDDYRVFIAGTEKPYPPERLSSNRALRGETASTNDIEIHLHNQVIPIESWGTPIFDEDGKVAYAITAFQDITERKKADMERARFTKELAELNVAYERFVPREFLSLLGKESVIDVQLGDQIEKEMTVLFSDIRGFTALSETMTPQENFNFINSFLSKMEPIISEHHGFIDKYIGDAIMALFPGGADDAVQAAIGMLQKLNEYNLTRGQPSRPILKIGIGIHTGMLMLGTVGGQNRMDGTVISDAVNVASRMEGLTKEYGTPLLITEQTFHKLKDTLQYRICRVGQVQVKGKSEPLIVYEVIDPKMPTIEELKVKMSLDLKQRTGSYSFTAFKEWHGLVKTSSSN